MGVSLPKYDTEGKGTISGYEGTYSFLKYEGTDFACKQTRNCVPKLRLLDCISDTWGRAYKNWEQFEGEDCTEEETFLTMKPNFFKFGEDFVFEVERK